MRAILIVLFSLSLFSCSNKESDFDGSLLLKSNDSGIVERVEAQFVKRHNCYELEITKGIKLIELTLSDLEVGEYVFGRGEINSSIWLTSYFSNWEEENSGILRVSQNQGTLVSGEFEINFVSDIDNSKERVSGEFENLRVDTNVRIGKSQGVGKVNMVQKGTSFSDVLDYPRVRSWRLYRPEGEVLWIYLNTDMTEVGLYTLNRDSLPVNTILPHIEYAFEDRLYTSSMGQGELEILDVDMDNARIECVLTAQLGNFKDRKVLELENYRMELYRE